VHIEALNLSHFGFREFLFLGGSHNTPGHRCHGLNALPPRSSWSNLDKTALVLDELRKRLAAPVRLNSLYRNQAYNSCLSGAAAESQHKQFRAADFTASDGRGPAHWRAVLREMRDEGFFSGGIGIYNTFVHVDTRGTPADWDERS
jgi:lysozyme